MLIASTVHATNSHLNHSIMPYAISNGVDLSNQEPKDPTTQSNRQVKNVRQRKAKLHLNGTRRYFREYCENTSIHGFKYLAENRTVCERIIWFLLISLSIAACGFWIIRIYYKYVTSPVIVSFATKESPLHAIPFPAVTVCPMTKVRKSVFNFTRVVYDIMDEKNITDEEQLYGQYLSLVCYYGQKYFRPKNTFNANDFYEKIDQMKLNISEYTDGCQYLVDADVSCEKLFHPIILDESVCYTFNMLDRTDIFQDKVFHFKNYHVTAKSPHWDIDKGYTNVTDAFKTYPYNAYLAGYGNGLQITFKQPASELDYMCLQSLQGFSVALHAPHVLPQLNKQFFQVSFGDAVMAAVQPKMMKTSQKVRKYHPDTRECYFTNEKYLTYFKQYTPSNCRLECYTNYTLEMCKCVQFFMPRNKTTPICGNGRRKCIKKVEFLLKVWQLKYTANQKSDTYFCDCKPSCVDITYMVEHSQSIWNYKELHLARRRKPVNESYLYARLTIFFKQESFLTSERNELYGPTDFLANFGGLLGLFTGFSFLSLAEIIYFLSVRICCNFRLYNIWTGPKN
ncbi:unnamed protein product [Acanthoscelides obtectus]|uniref:Uncharacterized protein n=1 Tax=Acanthoscelides obtectus TaxID=200917 RepID=A0A9P0PQK9_ACAOB|nr:unnamed protein product [Acanthoscelides obtectus]CAK1635380.1 Pickpocket protein 28 [Acanthoscelides obtectus]